MKEYQPYIPKEECVNLPHYWNEEDLSAISIARLAEAGRSFDFLKEEDIYSDYLKKKQGDKKENNG